MGEDLGGELLQLLRALVEDPSSHVTRPCCSHGWTSCRVCGPPQQDLQLLEEPTCNILFDVMNLADGVVTPKHVQIKGLGVFSHTGPYADVRSCPPGGENIIRMERDGIDRLNTCVSGCGCVNHSTPTSLQKCHSLFPQSAAVVSAGRKVLRETRSPAQNLGSSQSKPHRMPYTSPVWTGRNE